MSVTVFLRVSGDVANGITTHTSHFLDRHRLFICLVNRPHLFTPMQDPALKKRLRATLLDLFKINEIYPNEKEVIEYVTKRLAEHGYVCELDGFRNLIIRLAGEGEPVLFSTHLDIPEPAPNVRFTEEGDVIRSDGSGILGVDPKTGLAILIEFLINEAQKPSTGRLPVEVLLTRGEETGLFGARNADYGRLQSKMGLVLDEDGPVTQVVTRAPAYVRFDAEFHGKIVHPREPENGINALQATSMALMSVPWGYSTPGVTWNVGLLSSGTARNSVPGLVKLNAEIRSYDTALAVSEGERIEKSFSEQAAKIGATCVVDKELEFEGYSLEHDHQLFARLEKTFAEMKLIPNYFETFGGSDANIFNAKGIRCVPIGSAYYNAHQYTEYADVEEMARITEFLHQFIR